MRPIRKRLAILLLPALALLLPSAAAAFPLSNCTLQITSRDASGSTIDTAQNGADDATQSDPFVVDYDGTVAWVGTTGSLVIKNNSWHVDVFNLPTPLRGGDANDAGNKDGDGTVEVGANLPIQIVGLFYVSGEISGEGGSCSGSGWMKLDGNPFGTILFWVGAILLVLALLLLWGAFRGSWVMGVVGGLLLGLAAAILLIVFAVMLVGSWTPLTALLVGIVLGIGVRLVGPGGRPAVA